MDQRNRWHEHVHLRQSLCQDRIQFRFLSYGSLTEWKNIPNYAANKTVDRSLILGASWTAASGETTDGKARFFNGAVYDFQVFDTALTDAQITTLMEAN